MDKDGNEITLMELLPLKEESVFDKVESRILYEKVLDIIEKNLNEREKEIIKKRYGIECNIMTQLEISKQLNISRSYVSRIEKKAIGKIYKAIKGGN